MTKVKSSLGAAARAAIALSLAAGPALVLTWPSDASAQIRWRSGANVVDGAMDAAGLLKALGSLRHEARGEGGATRCVVSFDRALDDAEKASLARSGLTLLNYLNDNSFFASLDPDLLNPDVLIENAALVSVRPIERVWKMHPDVASETVRPWQLVGEVKPGTAAEQQTIALYVLLHKDADAEREGAALLQRHGGSVVTFLPDINGLVVELPAGNVKALASEDSVMYLEPPLPPMQELNAGNRVRTEADTVNAAPYNLDGAGVTVMVYDGGRVFEHGDFAGRLTQGEALSDSTSDHSTHVAGTIGGSGAGNITHRGMAPGVQIISYAFEVPGGLSQGFLYTNPGDLQADYTAAIAAGADISNNSIGTNTESNGYPCEWHGNYGVTDVLIDQIVRGTPGITNGEPFRVVWAAGNERQGSRCDVEFASPNQDYGSTAPPGMAKNQISVGALNSNDDSMTTFSSWGPGDDGRMRPDISAPGCQVGGDNGVTSCLNTGVASYGNKCGTSMASPTVCGLGALIMQDYRSLYPSRPEMRNSTLKTVLAHTAVDLGNIGPDNQFGYGSVRVQKAIDFVRTNNHYESSVTQGGVVGSTIVVRPGDAQLKVTIAWDDAPGTPNVNPVLVNDLDLVVFSPGGTQVFPWTLSGTQPWLPAVQTQRNSVDNIEQVLVNNPQPGSWRVEVRGFNVPQGPQTFSLSASPFLVACASQGNAGLDRERYNCSSLAQARVSDCDLNTSDSVVDTVSVTIASTSNPAGLSVLLTEIAPEAAEFRGTIQLSSGAGPGELQVVSGDVVTLTYQDADTGSGSPAVVTDTAVIDCTGPVITGVAATNVAPRSADIVFTTNEPSSSVSRFGAACGSLGSSSSNSALRTSHSFTLTGLADNTTYFFRVEATDESGNASLNDNGGACFSFTTPETPDYFTEIFLAGDSNDLDNRSIYFIPVPTFEGYSACSFTITELPNSSSGGTLLSLPDDSPSTLLTLTGGASIQLYGVSYTSFYLNPNGNITFAAGDSDTGESLTDHFSRPRISILFDDLNPTQGGSVRWQQLSDRVVITYLNVPKHNAGAANGNTFQYELFFDGRIGFHYLNIAIADGLAGIARGPALPGDFFESDLSSYASCGPRPPSAGAQSLATPRGTPLNVTLLATDDGLPTPGALRYIITALPASGRLFDAGSGIINSAPYELVAGGNVVRFEPPCTFQGDTAFSFKANDFGSSPSGGDSNIASVGVRVGGPQVVRSFLVDNANPDWTMDAAWAFGQPTGGGGSAGGGSGSPDPVAGFTGTNVLGYNLAGNYTNNLTPARNLTSGAIDCSAITGAQLRFQRWLGIESSSFDQASVQISTNGTTWSTVWAHAGASLNPNGAWTQVTYDIAQWADGQPTVYLRWVQGTTDGSVVYCGWNIDDIEILAYVPVQPCPADYNDDCAVNFADITFVLSNFTQYNFSAITNILSNFNLPCP